MRITITSFSWVAMSLLVGELTAGDRCQAPANRCGHHGIFHCEEPPQGPVLGSAPAMYAPIYFIRRDQESAFGSQLSSANAAALRALLERAVGPGGEQPMGAKGGAAHQTFGAGATDAPRPEGDLAGSGTTELAKLRQQLVAMERLIASLRQRVEELQNQSSLRPRQIDR